MTTLTNFQELIDRVRAGEVFVDSEGQELYSCIWGGLVSKRKSMNDLKEEFDSSLIKCLAYSAA